MKGFIYRIAKEKYLFLLLVILNMIPILRVNFLPSMDGPAHLYNSNLIIELLSGDASIGAVHSLNTLPIPNWTGHAILAFFNAFLPAFLAEKALLIIYLIGLPYGFRYLIRTINPENIAVSYLIIPFTYNFLFLLGFYNFSLSLGIMFASLAYWINMERHGINRKKILILGSLLLVTYFSHIFALTLTLFLIGIQTIWVHSTTYGREFLSRKNINKLGKKIGIILGVSAAPLILFVWYYSSREAPVEPTYIATSELIDWIYNLRPLIVYNLDIESEYTRWIAYSIGALGLIAIARLIISNKLDLRAYFGRSVYLLITCVILLILYFNVPDSDGYAGFVTVRLCLMAFLLFILWIAAQYVHKWFIYTSIIVSLYAAYNLDREYAKVISNLDEVATACAETGQHIQEGSTVAPIRFHNNWLSIYFSNYLGSEKPMIILDNYEAGTGYFPILWDIDHIPNYTAGDLESGELPCAGWVRRLENDVQLVDYLFIFKDPVKLEDPCALELIERIEPNYNKSYENEYCILYRRNDG